MDEKKTGATSPYENQAGLVDILAVLLRKRRIILWTTGLGLVLALSLNLAPRVAPSLFGRVEAKQESSSLRVLVLEDGLGPITASLATSQSFKDALEKDQGEGAADSGKLSVSFDAGTKTLSIIARGASADKAAGLAQAAFAQLSRLAMPLGGKRYSILAQAMDAEASRLALGKRPEGDSRYEDSRLATAVAARANRIVAEIQFRASTSTMDSNELAYKVQEAVVRTYQDAEKAAILELAQTEIPSGALSQNMSQRLDFLVAANLLSEAHLYRSISHGSEESFSIIGVAKGAAAGPAPFSLKKTLVLGFFASLFLGLLLAFISNAWDGIKADPAAMEKLKGALGPQKKPRS